MLEHKPHAQFESGTPRNPGLEPVGVEGCKTCAALSVSRELAREEGLPRAVAWASREIENHPHSGLGQGRALPVSTVWGVAS